MKKRKKALSQPTDTTAPEAPVLTGHDERAYRRSADRREWDTRESDAPDGVSGNWS